MYDREETYAWEEEMSKVNVMRRAIANRGNVSRVRLTDQDHG